MITGNPKALDEIYESGKIFTVARSHEDASAYYNKGFTDIEWLFATGAQKKEEIKNYLCDWTHNRLQCLQTSLTDARETVERLQAEIKDKNYNGPHYLFWVEEVE